jgi:NADPH:quinone reductase-like Zn-dependent oxidoreductase
MKAAVLRGPGEVPEHADFDDPQVPEGYELVEIVAAGIHPVVRSIAAGRHYGSTGTWPLVPGVDAVARTAAGGLIYTGFVRPPHGTALGRRGLGEDDADISYVQIGALAGPEAAVPSALLRSRHIRISGSGAGSSSIAVIRAEMPAYLGLIADGRVEVPVRTFPLPAVSDAWLAAASPATAW